MAHPTFVQARLARRLALLCLAFPVLASAHVSLQEPTAVQGAYHRAAFKVGHGCAGAATTELAVLLPEGLTAVRPMPKPGWQLATETVPAGTRVVWRGGPLDDRHYDEFVMQFKVTAPAGALWLPVEQRCTQGRNDWTERPATGTSTQGLRFPAVLLEVVAPSAGGHAHH